jgi:hypothetical protein
MCREIVRVGGHEAAARAVRKHANVRQLFNGGCDIFGQLERSGESSRRPMPLVVITLTRRRSGDKAVRTAGAKARALSSR